LGWHLGSCREGAIEQRTLVRKQSVFPR
jgi:hypothetical protein